MLVPTGAIRPDCGSMKAILTVLVWATAKPVAASDAQATSATFMESRNILSPLWNTLWQQEYWKRTRPVKQTEHSNHTLQSPATATFWPCLGADRGHAAIYAVGSL